MSLPGALAVATVVLAACASAAQPPGPGAGGGADRVSAEAPKPKVLVAAVLSKVEAMTHAGSTSTLGGWQSYNEIHSNGLVTSEDQTRRPIPRLAAELPSLDKGTMTVLADGRMRVVYSLRRDVTWHDGSPFTAHDLVFTQQVLTDRRLPSLDSTGGVRLMQAAEAPDDHTLAISYAEPYYEAGVLGVRLFAPIPRHIMQPVYEQFVASVDPQVWLTSRYWTDQFVSTGPFRMAEFVPGEHIVLERHDAYFLGRPNLDRVILRIFSDPNTLMANLLSGEVQLMMDTTLTTELGLQLKERWESAGGGTVVVKTGLTWFLQSQHKEGVQKEAANLQIPVRQAMYQALDKGALVDALLGGRRELIADAILPPDHPLFEHTKDVFKRYPFDPERSKAILREQGWTPGSDGVLRHASDGRRYQTSIWGTAGRSREPAAMADFWRRIGIEVEEFEIPAARVRDERFRATIPGWASTAAGSGDRMFDRLRPPEPGLVSMYSYDNPAGERLRANYIRALTPLDQGMAVQALANFWARELPTLVLYHVPDMPGVARGGRALTDDGRGGADGSQAYGTFTRNAHRWDMERG
jgi:peptide/nickel transport system substrate-binding protein